VGGGVVYKLGASGTYTVLYGFTGGVDGGTPYGGITPDTSGNLYGTTYFGGTTGCAAQLGCGVVFGIDAAGNYAVLQTLTGDNGGNPRSGVVLGTNGALYGTTQFGGLADAGVLYKLVLP
jgi:hypothetical protein